MKFSMIAALALAMIFGVIAMPNSTVASPAANAMPMFQDNCVVRGNNNIPLRVRSSPNGRIIGSLKVGTQIKAWDLTTDSNGVDWTKISFKRGFGWVATEFVSCG
ncbi:MAG: SH3 domain-containing protein [Blastocatellia bacterium]|nr:SH3 domain-containing protein [Blastocatellia bacterium]